ncbi:hypothetical protein CEXT_614241 [Caerostris extrusa]|uniref:Uncharacterized protein n=1 Tax=Caerostris extrusa TaxID=172846 RepID=A0AAV4X1D9_CAEEX|nr:hypothetical protein CEXT_614241 [Caerostris extrusa]
MTTRQLTFGIGETKGVEGRCSSVHQMDRREIPHSNLSHKLPENELAREVVDFQELMEMFDVMECLMVLSGGWCIGIEYSFSLSGQMPTFLYLSSSGFRVHWAEISPLKYLRLAFSLITGPRVRCFKYAS